MDANAFVRFVEFLKSDLSAYPVKEWAVFCEAERLGLSGEEAENAVAICDVPLNWKKLEFYFNQ